MTWEQKQPFCFLAFAKNPACAIQAGFDSRSGVFDVQGKHSSFYKCNNIIGSTLKHRTQFFQSIHGDGFVAPQICDGVRAKAVFIDQRIGGNTIGLHCLP